MTCIVDKCSRPALKRGYCNAHYLRWWRYGAPEAGSTGWGAAADFYENVVKSYDGEACLTWPFATIGGYGQIRIAGKLHLVSRLVCECANGDPPTPSHEAAHSCGNGHLGCVNKTHLRWATRQENRDDMVAHGRSLRGQRNRCASLSEKDVRSIRAMLGAKSQRAIAATFGVSQSAITAIATKKTWSWLES